MRCRLLRPCLVWLEETEYQFDDEVLEGLIDSDWLITIGWFCDELSVAMGSPQHLIVIAVRKTVRDCSAKGLQSMINEKIARRRQSSYGLYPE
jgi:hypothetical protein